MTRRVSPSTGRLTAMSGDRCLLETGAPNLEMPTMMMRVELTDRPGGVTMTVASRFPSLEAMEQLVAMGMVEGMKEAMGQIDAILAGAPAR